MVDTSDEWIIKRTGISERRILDEKLPIYSMAVKAAKNALQDSGIAADAIDLIIVTTSTPDYLTPNTSSVVQKETGAVNAAAFDISAACSGFLYGMTVAKQFIETGCYNYVLLVSSEGMSRVIDWTDRNNCILFGDAAGAVVLGRVEEGYGIISSYIGADGTLGNNITIPCLHMSEEDIEKRENYKNKKAIWQDGREVFKFASKIMQKASVKTLEDAGMNIDDIRFIIPHQANIRIIDNAIKGMGQSEDKIYTTINKYGNISSASIPVALDDAYKTGSLKKGDNLLFVAFGGGLTWASAILKWSK